MELRGQEIFRKSGQTEKMASEKLRMKRVGREKDGPQGQNLQEGQMVRTQLLSDRSP